MSASPAFTTMEINKDKLKAFLEGMYYVYARRELIYPDPLYFLYNYEDIRDREVVGLITSSLAYGRVAQIMKSSERVLACLGTHPSEFLLNAKDDEDIVPSSFKHRFTTSVDMNNYLHNISGVLKEYGSIEAFVGECKKNSDGSFLETVNKFAERMSLNKVPRSFSLVTAPRDGSACKRIFMFFRWLVRSDLVDPGGWDIFSPSQLIHPLDTHIFRFASALGLLQSSAPNLSSALALTSSFSLLSPLDPVRYDFSVSRFGIRNFSGVPYPTTTFPVLQALATF